ncbi:hypothetical protein [Porphyromonas uenonis]|uniref:hypothetical protein n=1 Tax=Porphyromonas uenonis TaxID=281920 RepID=UPI0026F20238|nr:hypothetical protein [Porphyromonas uenonis]
MLNGKDFRRDSLYEAKGGRYFTIDATPQFVIEVNPGESSDRHGENSAELFASWFVDAFFTNNTNN